jgi:hypothetical protein
MNCKMLLNLVASVALPSLAVAAPITGHFLDDGRCDAIAEQMLNGEIGDVGMFPAVDAIAYHDHRYNVPVGVPDDGIANDWTVHMTNMSGRAWRDLFFVADAGATIGNADGQVEDFTNAEGLFADAFHIDASGVNANLLHESIAADGIFQPGEEWEFAVTNFGTGANSIPPTLVTPEIFAGSSPLGTTPGNASILAVPAVPEPATLGGIALFAMSLLMRRRRRAAHSSPRTLGEAG